MIAGTHHHPRSLNLFLVFLSVNMGVLFFFRGELANRFFLCMAFARYFSLFHHLHSVIWFPPDFFPALLGWRRDDLTPPFSEHESKWSEGVDDGLFLARRSKCLFFFVFSSCFVLGKRFSGGNWVNRWYTPYLHKSPDWLCPCMLYCTSR